MKDLIQSIQEGYWILRYSMALLAASACHSALQRARHDLERAYDAADNARANLRRCEVQPRAIPTWLQRR